MAFFEYASWAAYFSNEIWVWCLVGGLCFAIVFVFQAVALYTIAKREGYKNRWMAFIPFLNTYYIGVCAQKNNFYNIGTKKIGIAAAVFEFVLFALYFVYYAACIIILKSGVEHTTMTDLFGSSYYYYNIDEGFRTLYPHLVWAAWMYNNMTSYILSPLNLVYTLIQISLLICFFQTYASRRYVLFTITSILFPIQGILFFVVCNNKGVNYREFLRAEQARQYAMYQQYQQQNFNQNPYSRDKYNQNPYNGNSYGNGPDGNTNNPPPPEDPFGDLGGSSGGSPFDDFDKNRNNNKN